MKHAFLILTHNEFRVLQALVSRLDDERNDIFVHFDKNVKDIPELPARVCIPEVFFDCSGAGR